MVAARPRAREPVPDRRRQSDRKPSSRPEFCLQAGGRLLALCNANAAALPLRRRDLARRRDRRRVGLYAGENAGAIKRRDEDNMRIVCIGGGPAGLYFGLLMKKFRPEHEVTVIERNKPYDTFGWGVVFSDAMMTAMRAADPESAAEIADAFNHWDDIELVFKGSRQRTSGHGFIGIGRKQLLNILQRRCEALGVELAFEREVGSDIEFPDADLIVAADGFNSKIRHRYPDHFRPDLLVRPNRYIWLGTAKAFDAFTFDFRKT